MAGNTDSIHPAFEAQIEIIGINPFVYVPDAVLEMLFSEAGFSKGKIPVQLTIDGHAFAQTLVKYAGHWRLYLNGPMRKAAGKEVGHTAVFTLKHNKVGSVVALHPSLAKALAQNRGAQLAFDALTPSHRHEIMRYINHLKTAESVERNVARAIRHLLTHERFIGRGKN